MQARRKIASSDWLGDTGTQLHQAHQAWDRLAGKEDFQRKSTLFIIRSLTAARGVKAVMKSLDEMTYDACERSSTQSTSGDRKLSENVCRLLSRHRGQNRKLCAPFVELDAAQRCALEEDVSECSLRSLALPCPRGHVLLLLALFEMARGGC